LLFFDLLINTFEAFNYQLTIRLLMIYRIIPILIIVLFSFSSYESSRNDFTDVKTKSVASNRSNSLEFRCKSVYEAIDSNQFSLPKFDVFLAAFQGYEAIKQQGRLSNDLLTVIDFSLPSTEERLWVIDMQCQQVVLKSLVAHGRNSGIAYATDFSNENESFKSSLGFYLTGEVYNGKHGMSMRLDGLEYGINHKARERAVVVHGADYVNEKLAQKQGYIGRSLGCPAVPIAVHLQLIQLIKNKSCLFIYHPSHKNFQATKLLS
jgi:hypothetical protein